jgi:hypothetical protein
LTDLFVGTHLDVGNVCAILAGIGFLENYQSTSSSSAASDQNLYQLKSANMTTELCKRWGIVLEDDPTLQRVPSSSQFTAKLTPEPEKSKPTSYSQMGTWLQNDMACDTTSPNVLSYHSSHMTDECNSVDVQSHSKIDGDSGEDDTMDALSGDLEFDLIGNDRLDADSSSVFQPTLDLGIDLNKEDSFSVDNKSSRKGSSSTKMWRICESVRQGNKLQLVTLPEAFFDAVVDKAFDHEACLEVEEKLLRYVANQCKVDFPESSYSCATSYLDLMIEDEAPQGKQTEASSTAMDVSDMGSLDIGPPKDLFDVNICMTAEYLLSKVARSKRQRGAALVSNTIPSSPTAQSLQAPTFNMKHIDQMREVVEKTTDSYWMVDEANKPLKKKRSNSTTQSSLSIEKIALAEFARSTNTSFSNSSLSNHVFTNVQFSVESPVVTMAMWKHYVPAVFSYEEELVTTVEIPWSTAVAPEFQPVGIDDCEANGVVVEQDKSVELGSRSHSGTEHTIVATSKASVVEAPLFHEVDREVMMVSMSMILFLFFIYLSVFFSLQRESVDDEESEEDISDEAMLHRHEQVLRRMREKWALLQKLKSEARRESGGSVSNTGTNKKVMDMRSPPMVRVTESELKVNSADRGKNNNNDPDSGSENQLKKRGRPPKTPRYSHYSGRYS